MTYNRLIILASLILSLTGCEPEEVAPSTAPAGPAASYTPDLKSPDVWIEGQITLWNSSAADFCSGRETHVEVLGSMKKQMTSGNMETMTWPFSSVSGKAAYPTSCGDWSFEVKLEKRIENHDGNGNPTYAWVPESNNNSIGYVDSSCRVHISSGVNYQAEGKRVKIQVIRKPNNRTACNAGCVHGTVIQCSQMSVQSTLGAE